MQDKQGDIYDFPKYYDLIFGSDWKAEFNFLLECFAKFVPFEVQSIFEPACGTGRLLYRYGKHGIEVAGNDLNAKSIDFCNKRLMRHGLPATTVVGDMTCFKVEKPFDAAFNMINSFRHLGSEQQATDHLKCMRAALNPGGIYVMGLHLSPLIGETCDTEAWSASRGNLTVNSSFWLVERNLEERYETYGMNYDIYTPTEQKQIKDELRFRTYTATQFEALVDAVSGLVIEDIYDFRYDLDSPLKLDDSVEDVVFILKAV